MLTLLAVFLCSCTAGTISLSDGEFVFGIDSNGYLCELEFNGKNYLSHDIRSPFVQLYDGDKYINPCKVAMTGNDSLTVEFENGSEAVISVSHKEGYFCFRLLSLDRRNGIRDFVWGPYNTTIFKWIGETICTLRDDDFAFGVWSLNPVTVEGLPDPDNIEGGMFIDPLEGQALPSNLVDSIGQRYPTFDDYTSDLPEYVRIYRSAGARKTTDGSQVRLHARDHRLRDTVMTITGGPVATEPIDVDYIGSAVAIFGCENEKVLDYIENIEICEGLPHPEIDGIWIKRNPKASDAYLMYEGSNPYVALDYADSLGFERIHIGDPFASWGKFPIETKRFPGGAEDLKAFTDKARERGKYIGIHSLTMFTTVNDGYVTPEASPHLASFGKAILEEDISKTADEFTISDTAMFINPERTKSLRIGTEIMSYSGVENGRIKGVVRGQFGTVISAHRAGDTVAHLKNNCYDGFYPDIYTEKAYADRLAEVVNETGVELMDLDGFDGGHNGHGQYEMAQFAKDWYDGLEKGIYNCGSCTSQFYWHVYSYMNWGEPWYANLRESMPRYREENQRYFRRNLMPGMLGWYSIGPEFRIEDIEWINARSVGHDAGYLLNLNDEIEKSGIKTEIFNAFRLWQEARRNGVFSEKQLEDLRNISKDFHLEPYGNEGWYLTEITMKKGFFKDSTSIFDNPFSRQPVSFYGYINGGDLTSLTITIGGTQHIEVPFVLHDGDRLLSDGLNLYVTDRYWNKKASFLTKDIMWNEGSNPVTIKGTGNAKVSLEMRALGKPVVIKRKNGSD